MAQVDAIADASAASKLLPTIAAMESLLKGLDSGLHPSEKEGIEAQLDCLKSGVKFLEEKKHFEALQPAGQSIKKLNELVRSWIRYIKAVKASETAPKPKLMASDFVNLAAIEDPFIMQVWSGKSSELETSVSKSDEALTALMEPGAGWKADLGEAAELETVVAQAENTIMKVKGRKLTAQRDSLVQARSFKKKHVQENIHFWLDLIWLDSTRSKIWN